MKYGMNMLLWTTDVNESHFGILESLKKIGYDGVELPIFDMDVEHTHPITLELLLRLKTQGGTVPNIIVHPEQPDRQTLDESRQFLRAKIRFENNLNLVGLEIALLG